jgi:CPA1 family monovalent cation:H+ antiporter
MSDDTTIDLGLILLVASVVAMISRRIRLPYSVGLVAAGILLARWSGPRFDRTLGATVRT